MTVRRRSLALLGAAVSLAAAGCTAGSARSAAATGASPEPSGTPAAVVASATRSTEAVTSADLTQTIVETVRNAGAPGASGGSAPASVAVAGTGAYDFTRHVGDLTLHAPANTTITIRQLGGTVYLSLPKLTSVDGGKPWISVPLGQYTAKLSHDNPLFSLTPSPTALLGLLDKLGAHVTAHGQAVIGGVTTTRYQGSLDLATLAGTLFGSTAGLSPQQKQQVQRAFAAVPVEVDVGAHHHIRQVVVTITVGQETLTTTFGFSHFGVPVTTTAPPANQTAPGAAVLPELGALLSGGAAAPAG